MNPTERLFGRIALVVEWSNTYDSGSYLACKARVRIPSGAFPFDFFPCRRTCRFGFEPRQNALFSFRDKVASPIVIFEKIEMLNFRQ
jgi:hypothetical protein